MASFVDFAATAKTDLMAGGTLDSIVGYLTYLQCEKVGVTSEQELFSLGLAEECHFENGCKA